MARCKTWGSIYSQNRAGWDFAPPAEALNCDHLNAQDVGRRFQSIFGQSVRASRPCGCLCRGAEDRSLDFAQCTRAGWTRRSGMRLSSRRIFWERRIERRKTVRTDWVETDRVYFPPASLRTKFAAAVRPAISFLRSSNRCRASLSRSSTNFMAASPVNGPLTTGTEFSPIVSST